MKVKNMILITLMLLLILTVGSVSAADDLTNQTQDLSVSDNFDSGINGNTENEKQDLNVSISFGDVLKPHNSEDGYQIAYYNLPNDYKSQINVYIDGKFALNTEDLYERMPVEQLSYGSHTLKVQFLETEKYNPLNLTCSFEVTKGYISIPTKITNSGWVAVRLTGEASGNFIVKVDGKEFKKVNVKPFEDDETSGATVTLSGLSAGTHTVEATYSGDKKHDKIYKKVKVNVKYYVYISSEIQTDNRNVNPNRIAYGYDNVLNIYHSTDIKKAFYILIDGTRYNVTRKNSEMDIFKLSGIMPGTHNLSIVYPGDDKYPMKTAEEQFTLITLINLKSASLDGVVYGESYACLILPNDAKGNLTVSIAEKFFKTQEIVDGFANISLGNLSVGTYFVDIEYSGNDYNVERVDSSPLRINPKLTYPRVVDYGKSATIYIDMGPGINGYVECYIDPYDPNWLPDTCDAKIPIVDGKANLTLTNLKLSKYVELADINNRVYFKFHYENQSREISCDAVILVNPKVPKMGTLKDTSMYLGTYKQIKVKVYGYDGKAKAGQKVYVKMNSEVFFVKTDSNGYASFNVLEKVGTYSITFYCCKNKDLKDYKLGWYDTVTYKSVKSNTIKLTVKHFLTLKSVTVKKSAKKLTLQATASIGSPIKNAKVTFKFNGKTYTKRTDSKGVAKITISKSVLSKLKVGKKITYQATCGEDTVKKTAIVKK